MNALDRAKALQARTRDFALRIVRTSAALPTSEEARVICRQFLRSGTSIAANYRAACRSRSDADFVSKISIVTEEADETLFWLELLRDAQIVTAAKIQPLIDECEELVRIFSASRRTARRNR